VEEFFLHLWDEWDDLTGLCRHVATEVAAEVVSAAVPFIAAIAGTLFAAATLLIAHREFLSLIG
jgi:hypothetical protein